MQKKFLRSLDQIKTWLKASDILTPDLDQALKILKQGIEQSDLKITQVSSSPLPVPIELSGSPESLAIFTDGGCRGNPGPGAYAFVAQNIQGEILAQAVEFESHTTNNKMELQGPIRGLTDIKQILEAQGLSPKSQKIKVMTDSKYVVDGMKSWVLGWKNRGWKKADNKAPENLELWKTLDFLAGEFSQIEWVWVKGHSGHPQNEFCDQLVNELMDENISL
jgi:ribonuclease HI